MPSTKAVRSSAEADSETTQRKTGRGRPPKRTGTSISRQDVENAKNQDIAGDGGITLRRSRRLIELDSKMATKDRDPSNKKGQNTREINADHVTKSPRKRRTVNNRSRNSSFDDTDNSELMKKFKQMDTDAKIEPILKHPKKSERKTPSGKKQNETEQQEQEGNSKKSNDNKQNDIGRQEQEGNSKKSNNKKQNETGQQEQEGNSKKSNVKTVIDDGTQAGTSKSDTDTKGINKNIQASGESRPDQPTLVTPTSMSNDNTEEYTTPSDKLSLILSNLYLNAAERLKLDFAPRCAEDLEYCHQHHYRAPLPEAPNHTQANNLRCALQQQRYLSFVNLLYDMCHRGEYPGEGILTKIIELVLSFNPKCFNNESVDYFLGKSIEIFAFIVRKFPPCWLSLRPFYMSFFRTPPDPKKIFRKKGKTLKSENMFGVLLELLEHTLEQCSSSDLQSVPNNYKRKSNLTTGASTENTLKSPSKHHLNNDSSQNSECLNIWEWEVQENGRQTFEALDPLTRLGRIFTSLSLLLLILESDLVMWILHHHKKAKVWIFCEESRPYVVEVLSMTKYTRTTNTIKQLFKLFAISINKEAPRAHVHLLERLISLAFASSNIADLERSPMGVHYPNLGSETKALIHAFFKTFKSHNITRISSYLKAVHLLRLPYVRCEFVNCFFKYFCNLHCASLTPKQITSDIFKKRWLKYGSEMEQCEKNSDVELTLTRQQYLKFLLIALKAYCEWHGTKEFFYFLIKDKIINSFQTSTNSLHHCPVKNNGSLMLDSMMKDIKKLEPKLRMSVNVCRPKVSLPLISICINEELLQKYRNDLKWLTLLRNLIEEEGRKENSVFVDFAAWKEFLLDYRGDENKTKDC